MKKSVIVLALVLMIMGTISLLTAPATQPKNNQPDQVDITFEEALSSNELISVVDQNDLQVVEIRYYDDSASIGKPISGGYTLLAGEDIRSALDNMKKKHFQFLKTMLKEIRRRASKETDQIMLDGSRELSIQFSDMLANLRRGKLDLSSMRVNGFKNMERLTQSIKIKSIIPVFPRSHTKESGVITNSSSHEAWAPYYGTSRVTTSLTSQFFYFNNVGAFGSDSTYEHETQVYESNFAGYNNYWSSNMPSAYYDTPFLDNIDTFTVGCAQASSLQNYSQYFAYMALYPEGAPSAVVRIKGQLGRRVPGWCYSTWCIFASATTTPAMLTFTAPVGAAISYNY